MDGAAPKKGPGKDEVELVKKGAEKVAGSVVKKSAAAVGTRAGGEAGGVVGAVVGTAATIATTKATKELPKEGVKAAAGFVTGKGIDYGTKFIVTKATTAAATATTTEAAKAGVQLAVAKGAAAAAGGGFASMAGELAGGFVGKKVGQGLAKRMKNGDVSRGAKIGEDVGALSGACASGAAFGAFVAGPVGAAGGAGLGAAGWGIGKATGVVIDKASAFEGVTLKTPKLKLGHGGCDQDEAAACVVTEESPGLGRCLIYFYATREEAQRAFNKWWCSRILFEVQEGRIVGELERAGWPWNQANMLASVRGLWAHPVPRPSVTYIWAEGGIASARQAGVYEFLGSPSIGDKVTDDQLEAFALSNTCVEQLAKEHGYFKTAGYRWTAAGVKAAADNRVLEFLGNPAAGGDLTDLQLRKFESGGTPLEKVLELGYVESA